MSEAKDGNLPEGSHPEALVAMPNVPNSESHMHVDQAQVDEKDAAGHGYEKLTSAQNRGCDDPKENKYDFSATNIQYEHHFFATFRVCEPHTDHGIRRPSPYIRAEVQRACLKQSIALSEIHASDNEICAVCSVQDDVDKILQIARKITSRLEAPPPPKYAVRISGCFMLTEPSLRDLLGGIGEVAYLRTGHNKIADSDKFFPTAFTLLKSSLPLVFPIHVKYRVNGSVRVMTLQDVPARQGQAKSVNVASSNQKDEWQTKTKGKPQRRRRKGKTQKTTSPVPQNSNNRFKILSRDSNSSAGTNQKPELTATRRLISERPAISKTQNEFPSNTHTLSPTAAPSIESLNADMDSYRSLRDLKSSKPDDCPDKAASLVIRPVAPRTPATLSDVKSANNTVKRTKKTSASRGKNKKKTKLASALSPTRSLPFSQSPLPSDDESATSRVVLSSPSSSDSDEDVGAQNRQ